MLLQQARLAVLLTVLHVDAASISDSPSRPAFAAEIKVQMQLKGLVGNDRSGSLILRLHPGWAPRGVRRFLRLLGEKFFDNCRFFRVESGFVAQFGISPDPEITDKWQEQSFLQDDPVLVSNRKGTLTFASTGEQDSRTTQLFFNLRDNKALDSQGFAPIGEVTEKGFEVLTNIFAGYGSVSQQKIEQEGEKFLAKKYPKMSIIKQARLITAQDQVEELMRVGKEEAARASEIPQGTGKRNTQVHSLKARWTIVGGCVGVVLAFVGLVLLIGRFPGLSAKIAVPNLDGPCYDVYTPSSPSKTLPLETTSVDKENIKPGKLEYSAGGKVQVATDLEEFCETEGLLSTPKDPPAKILGACSSDSII